MATSTIFNDILLKNEKDIDNFLDAIEESEKTKNRLNVRSEKNEESIELIKKVVKAYE